MPKQKTITIGGISVIVSEVSVTRIYRLLLGEESILNLPLPEVLEKVKAFVPLALSVDVQELLAVDLFSDDLDHLTDAFMETNPVFFTIARKLKLDSALAEIIGNLLTNFSRTFAGSLQPGTALLSGITDTDTSSTA